MGVEDGDETLDAGGADDHAPDMRTRRWLGLVAALIALPGGRLVPAHKTARPIDAPYPPCRDAAGRAGVPEAAIAR